MNYVPCVKCAKTNFLYLSSLTNMHNYFKWNEEKLVTGFMQKFSSITTREGCRFTICLECGWIVDLDLDKLKKDVADAYNICDDSDSENE